MEKFSTLWKMTGIIMVAIILGTALLAVAYSLPLNRIVRNAKKSVPIYLHEGLEPRWSGGWGIHAKVDTFSDAIMLLKATYPVENLILSICGGPSWPIVEGSPVKTLALAMEPPVPEPVPPSQVWNYHLYWHGYLVFLKPALMAAPVNDLRMFNFYLQFTLIVIAAILFYRRLGLGEMIAFLFVIVTINPITTAINFQNSCVLYVTLLATIFILLRNEFLLRGQNYLYFFLIIGIITSYFDLLSYPLTGFGIPLCVCVLMNKKFFFTSTPKEILKKLLSYLFAWGFGYGGMWVGKWLVTALLSGWDGVFDSAINRVLYRASTSLDASEGGVSFTIAEIFARNIGALLGGPFPIILGALIIALIYLIFVRKEKFAPNLSMTVTFLFIAVLPFIWYATARNHSYLHLWFAYRNLSITLFSVACFFIESLRQGSIKNLD